MLYELILIDGIYFLCMVGISVLFFAAPTFFIGIPD
jgi:hypothetical protein